MPNININWDPPAIVFVYQADLYCGDCVADIEHDLIAGGHILEQGSGDSEVWPVAYERTHGETDSPDHCGTPDCQRFLGRNLTEDGVEYVRQTALEELDQPGGVGPIVQGWLDFYDYIELDA